MSIDLMKEIDLGADPKEEPQVFVVREYPDEMLSRYCSHWLADVVDPELQTLLDSMEATMTAYRAHGISGPQVGIPYRIVSIQTKEGPLTLINPVVTGTGADEAQGPEGCLSFPGLNLKVRRKTMVMVSYTSRQGLPKTQTFVDTEARAVLHEIDHLDGIVFIDRIPKVMRGEALRKYHLAPRFARQQKRSMEAMIKRFEAMPKPKAKVEPEGVSPPYVTEVGEPTVIDVGGVLTKEIIEAGAQRMIDDCGTVQTPTMPPYPAI